MYSSTKIIELGSCAFRQPQADSHCRFLHGYRLTAKFWFEADHLDHNNWVVDFGALKELKSILQHQFDHTTCISRTDPKLDVFKKLNEAGVCDLRIMDGVGIEKFAEFCHAKANIFVEQSTQGRCRCSQVEVFEHENNSAIYKAPASSSFYGEKYLEARTDEIDHHFNKDTSATLQENQPKAAPKEQVSAETEAEDIATASDAKKSSVTKKSTQSKKSVNNWVDPEFKGKTTNTWRF